MATLFFARKQLAHHRLHYWTPPPSGRLYWYGQLLLVWTERSFWRALLTLRLTSSFAFNYQIFIYSPEGFI
jgi:hypothetical protein